MRELVVLFNMALHLSIDASSPDVVVYDQQTTDQSVHQGNLIFSKWNVY